MSLSIATIFMAAIAAGPSGPAVWGQIARPGAGAPASHVLFDDHEPFEALPEPWTLEALETLALAQHPDVLRAAARVEAAHGRAWQAMLLPNPVLGYKAEEVGEDGSAGKHGVFVEQRLVPGVKRTLRSGVHVRQAEQLQAEAQVDRQRLLVELRTRFYEALAAQRLVELRQDLVATAEEAEQTAQRLKQIGRLNRPDELMVIIALRQARVDAEAARLALWSAWRELAAAAGQPDLPPAPLEGDLDDIRAALDADESVQRALSESPQVRAALGRVQQLQAALAREGAEAAPDWHLRLESLYDFHSHRQTAGVEIGFDLPLRNRNQGNIAAAQAELAQAHAELQSLELALRQRHAQLFRRYETARQMVASYRTQLADATEALNMYDEAFEMRMAPFQQVLDARRVFIELSVGYVEHLRNVHLARVDLEALLLIPAPTR